MSIYIQGIGLPPSAVGYLIAPDGTVYRRVPMEDGEDFICRKIGQATELPPHGRLGDLDTLVDAIESIDWYHQNEEKDMVHGANSSEHQAWYKEQDVYAAIERAMTIIPAEEE